MWGQVTVNKPQSFPAGGGSKNGSIEWRVYGDGVKFDEGTASSVDEGISKAEQRVKAGVTGADPQGWS